MLTDGAATKKAMQAGIKALVRDSKKGDVALLHYSGHGSNVPDDNGDEADGRDEILCPADLDWDDPLRDDWLRTTLDGLQAGVSLTVIMDCCHSGHQHARDPAARRADQGALSAQPLEPEGGGIGTEPAEEGHAASCAARRARRARPRTSSRRSCPKCSSPAAATPRRRPTPSSTAGTTARSRLRWSRRFARARAVSPIEQLHDRAAGVLKNQEVRAGAAARRPVRTVRPAVVCRVSDDREAHHRHPLRQRPEPVGRRSAADSRLGSVCLRRAEAAVVGEDGCGHRGAAAPVAVRCGPAVRPHLLRPASSSRLADCPPARLHPDPRPGRRGRHRPAVDARARFAGNDRRGGRTGTAGPDRLAVRGARHGHRRRRVRPARRGGEDGVPQHRGQAAGNGHRRRAAHLVRARRTSRRGGSRCSCCSIPR